MQAKQQRQLDSLRRVQDFLNAHADVIGSLQSSEGRRQLDAAVAQLEAQTLDQSATNLDMTGLQRRENMLLHDLKNRHMQPIAIFARAKLRGVPDFAALAGTMSKRSRRQVVRAARAMAVAAAGHTSALDAAGFPANTIGRLEAAADAVDAAMTARANARVKRAGATKGISEHADLGREAVRMLHAVIVNQYGDDAPFIAAWRAAHRVMAKSGAPRTIGLETAPNTTAVQQAA